MTPFIAQLLKLRFSQPFPQYSCSFLQRSQIRNGRMLMAANSKKRSHAPSINFKMSIRHFTSLSHQCESHPLSTPPPSNTRHTEKESNARRNVESRTCSGGYGVIAFLVEMLKSCTRTLCTFGWVCVCLCVRGEIFLNKHYVSRGQQGEEVLGRVSAWCRVSFKVQLWEHDLSVATNAASFIQPKYPGWSLKLIAQPLCSPLAGAAVGQLTTPCRFTHDAYNKKPLKSFGRCGFAFEILNYALKHVRFSLLHNELDIAHALNSPATDSLSPPNDGWPNEYDFPIDELR